MTSVIGSTPIGGGGGPTYTDAQAIAAVNAWADKRYKLDTTLASATGVFASYMVIDTAVDGGPIAAPGPLAGGLYSVAINAVAGGLSASAGSQIEFQLLVDAGAFTLQGPLESIGLAGGRWAFSASPIILPPLAPGNHTFDLSFRQPGGPGTVEILTASLAIKREA